MRRVAVTAVTDRDAITTSRLLLFKAWLKPQWFDEGIAESNVHQPRMFEINPQGQVGKVGPFATVGIADAGGQQCYLETQIAEEGGKSSVQFVTETTAVFVDDLMHETIFIADDRFPQANVEVLEGDGEHVGAVEGAQRFESDGSSTLVCDAVEVGVYVQGST